MPDTALHGRNRNSLITITNMKRETYFPLHKFLSKDSHTALTAKPLTSDHSQITAFAIKVNGTQTAPSEGGWWEEGNQKDEAGEGGTL